MSAPERTRVAPGAAGARVGRVSLDIVELAARQGRADELAAVAAAQGIVLPSFGTASVTASAVTLAVRPGRWLVLAEPHSPGTLAAHWAQHLAAAGTAVDLSSALTALRLSGPSYREVLVRGCRLDLDSAAFGSRAAAATLMAQVSVTLASLGDGMLLLTPSTTARHFEEWLCATATPFGVERQSLLPFTCLCGDPSS